MSPAVVECRVPPVTEAVDEVGLKRAVAAGEPGARQRLYDRFAPVVHGIALAHVGRQDAEDLTQEVFLVVYDRLGTLREEGSLGAWVCTVARNLAIDHIRRRARRPQHEPLHDHAAPAQPGNELAEQILDLIQELPPAYREPLVLRLVEGLTGPEIASRMGMTHGSVRVNLCRGMAMLRPLLQEKGLP